MGKDSKIEWTHHTFNPWWGCARVSEGCRNCYAETFAKRFGVEWGVNTPRKMASESYMRQPLKWNADAEKAGERRRVFCASMADLFEDRRDLDEQRLRVFDLIEHTPWLDWLLLTKRPENMIELTQSNWYDEWPRNVWAMTTVENQKAADERIPELIRVPAVVHGLSCEPLLEYVDLKLQDIEWVICGGESGKRARPMYLSMARSLRDQCLSSGVPFHFKQWGEHNRMGENVGKHAAGRILDGRTWDEYPKVNP